MSWDTLRGTVLVVWLHVTWELAKPYVFAQSFTQCAVTDTNVSVLRHGPAICFTLGNVAFAKYKHGGRGHDNSLTKCKCLKSRGTILCKSHKVNDLRQR